jgi:Cu2+-exporting ATPase
VDKTGTLTEGKPSVTGIHWRDKSAAGVLLGLESRSEHPVAVAITTFLQQEGVAPAQVQGFTNIVGQGVQSSDGYFVGAPALAREQDMELDEEAERLIAQWQEEAQTVSLFFQHRVLKAVIAVSDPIKHGAATAVSELTAMGVEVVMLTGDHARTAAAIAQKTGIRRFYAGLMPGDKAALVEQLRKEGKISAMVGDGINDAQALALADISIAMGKGSDIAMDIAKITLMSGDIRQIPRAIRLSKSTVATIRQNLFWAFIYNLIGIPLAAGVLFPINGFLINPMIAGAAMALSSVSVVGNSLRGIRLRPSKK